MARQQIACNSAHGHAAANTGRRSREHTRVLAQDVAVGHLFSLPLLPLPGAPDFHCCSPHIYPHTGVGGGTVSSPRPPLFSHEIPWLTFLCVCAAKRVGGPRSPSWRLSNRTMLSFNQPPDDSSILSQALRMQVNCRVC